MSKNFYLNAQSEESSDGDVSRTYHFNLLYKMSLYSETPMPMDAGNRCGVLSSNLCCGTQFDQIIVNDLNEFMMNFFMMVSASSR